MGDRITEHRGLSAIREGMSRQDFLKLGGFSLAGAALLSFPRPAWGSTETSAATLGIKPGNTAAENRENLKKALRYSTKNIVFPPGDYFVDNSRPTVCIEKFGGTLTMEPGARFIFTDTTNQGISFRGGSGAQIVGLTATFWTLPTEEILGEECILFAETTDTVVRNIDVNGSAAGGLIFSHCVRPSIDGANIKNTLRDGLHIRNCQDTTVNNVRTENTGDDGVAFLNYAGMRDYTGVQATGITTINSETRGITVLGQSNVTIRDFFVDGTVGPGIYCAHEDNERYTFRVPENVTYSGGTVRRAGKVNDRPANKNGIDFYNVKSVKFENINIAESSYRGAAGVAPEGEVRFSNVHVKRIPGAGFHLSAKALYLNELTATNVNGTGFVVLNSESVEYSKLQARNTAKRDKGRMAFNFVDNRRVEGQELRVIDRQAQATGYTLRTNGAQDGKLGRVYDQIENGKLRTQNWSDLAVS